MSNYRAAKGAEDNNSQLSEIKKRQGICLIAFIISSVVVFFLLKVTHEMDMCIANARTNREIFISYNLTFFNVISYNEVGNK